MSYVDKVELENENLVLGEGRVENIKVKIGSELERGMVLCGASGEFEPVTSAADSEKALAIAIEDFEATSESQVTSAWTAGLFNSAKLKVGELDVADFVEGLRRDNIFVTEVK